MTGIPGLRRTAAGVVLGLALALGAAALPAQADDSRALRIREAVSTSGIYLEPGTAGGELALWTGRLRAARTKVRLDAPVRVALWSFVPGLAPTLEEFEADTTGTWQRLGLTRGIAITNYSGKATVEHDEVSDAVLDRVQALSEQTDAVATELIAVADDERYRRITPVAWTWIWLRLAGQEQPRPRELVAELAGNTSLFIDRAVAPDIEERYAEEDPGVIRPVSILVALLVLAATAGVFMVRWRREEAGREATETPPTRSTFAAELTDLQLEQEVAELAEAIARSDVQPGQRDYDRAQAHLDAAARHVDSQLDRDRVGCHLLAQDGLVLLRGGIVAARCFFHPGHVGEASVGKDQVRVPCCLRCATAVRAGERPPALFVADTDGKVAPYYDTHDVWTTTGYGSLPGLWAKRALLASLRKAVDT